MVEKHLLGQRRALAQAQQLDDAIFLGGQVDRLVVDGDGASGEVDGQAADVDHRMGVSLGTTNDRVDAGDQFAAVEGLGQVIVGATTKPGPCPDAG